MQALDRALNKEADARVNEDDGGAIAEAVAMRREVTRLRGELEVAVRSGVHEPIDSDPFCAIARTHLHTHFCSH